MLRIMYIYVMKKGVKYFFLVPKILKQTQIERKQKKK